MKHILIGYALLFFSCATYATYHPHNFTSIEEAKRYQTLINEIRCVACQGQSIADSNAPLANDLREKIYTMLSQHASDAVIKDYLVKRYGEFILLQPRFNKTTLLLWLFPFLGIVISLIFLAYTRKTLK